MQLMSVTVIEQFIPARFMAAGAGTARSSFAFPRIFLSLSGPNSFPRVHLINDTFVLHEQSKRSATKAILRKGCMKKTKLQNINRHGGLIALF